MCLDENAFRRGARFSVWITQYLRKSRVHDHLGLTSVLRLRKREGSAVPMAKLATRHTANVATLARNRDVMSENETFSRR